MKMKMLSLVAALALLFVAASVNAETSNFYQGIDLWLSSSNAADTGNPNLGFGRNTSGGKSYIYHSLIEFTDIFGEGTGQIPYGSTIDNATLNFYINYGNAERRIYDMTIDWNATSTWNSIGGGLIPGTNTSLTPVVSWIPSGSVWHWQGFDVTSSLQKWSDETLAANGWGLWGNALPSTTACSLDYGTVGYRPYLSVAYTPAVVPEPVSTALFLLGGATLAVRRLRKGRKA